jgi:hypothetical protein
MNHYVITTDGAVRKYKNGSSAAQAALGLTDLGAVTATDENLKNVPTSLLVVLHNIIRPEKPIKKFADRETAEKRMVGVLEVLAKPGEDVPVPESTASSDATDASSPAGEDTDMANKAKSRKSGKKNPKKERINATEGAGRPSMFAGKVIRKIATENPRRENSLGWKSWNLLKSGMTYEKYIEAGGRRTDLAWDIAHGFAKVEKA